MHNHHITSDPGGRPVIAGTHMTVQAVLKALAASEAVDVILATHPELDRDAIQAALEFAADTLPVLQPSSEEGQSSAGEAFVPHTAFGQEMWALHQAVVEEAKQRGEPLLETWEEVAREVRERRGERHAFEEAL